MTAGDLVEAAGYLVEAKRVIARLRPTAERYRRSLQVRS